MTLISYAQNFQDIVLWRTLQHVSDGFYVDVGANDPAIDSVTKLFHDRGWHGINIEPLPDHHGRLAAERTRDINLKVAAGARDGQANISGVPNALGRVSRDESLARRPQQEGQDAPLLKVPLRTLSSICAEHVSGDIHFLKVDVEGCEAEVLAGMDFERWRPWVLVIRTTPSNGQTQAHEGWEPLLTTHRYRIACFDGLNRYYVAEEHAGLVPKLARPVSALDDFVPIKALQTEAGALAAAQEVQVTARDAERRAQQAEARARRAEVFARQTVARAQQAEQKAHRAETKLIQAEASAAQANAALGSILATRSWRVTAPLRFTFDRAGSTLRMIKQVLTAPELTLLRKHDRLARFAPGLKAIALSVLDHLSGTKERLNAQILEGVDDSPPSVTVEDLGKRAQSIYDDLRSLARR